MYHWEHRAQRGLLHRWDNAPDHGIKHISRPFS
ncbi:toxin-antitoxin system TumE family protein [Methanobacterium aggregans]